MAGLRAALFVDYENLVNALKPRHTAESEETPAAEIPLRLDFELLIRSLRKRFGSLDQEDVVVVGDFRKHSHPASELHRLARLVDTSAYESRTGRGQDGHKTGVKGLARNAGNVALAYYIGLHMGVRPANIYLLLTGDSAAAAAADELLRAGKQVAFIIPNDTPSPLLAERYNCIPFSEVHPFDQVQPMEATVEESSKAQPSPSDEIGEMLSILHREFPGSGIPSGLLRAMLGVGTAQRQLDRARHENVIDLWKDPAGVECASLSRMRIAGKAVPMATRLVLRQASKVLLEVAKSADDSRKVWTRAEWRKVIKEAGEFSSSEAKQWLEALLEAGILRDAALGRPDFRLEKMLKFLKKMAAL